MYKHPKTSQDGVVDGQAVNSSPNDTLDPDNGGLSFGSPDPLGTNMFGWGSSYSGLSASFTASQLLVRGTPSNLEPATSTASGSGGASTVVSTSGSGLVFNNTYGASCTAQFEACIVAAEDQLESLFTNSDTIVVTFNESNSGNNGVALGNTSYGYTYNYATLKAALLKVAPNDVLPSTDPSNGGNWWVPEAYGRMLGLTTATGSPDLSVSLNTYYGWDFGQDVINGLTHELSEGGLGRIGGLGGSGGGNWGTMDLFRYNSAGQADYSNGRDGDTTYFSSNGGSTLSNEGLPNKGAPTLSYNNQYNSSGTQVNGGDTADWTQQSVFGSTGGGETLALTQPELELMQALGWHLSLKQDVDATTGSWETPADWSTGSMPIEAQDVYISSAIVSLDSNVIVNSLATSTGSTLTIGSSTTAATLNAVDGTTLNTEDSSSVASGSLGSIFVSTGSALQIGFLNETFDNAGTLTLGKGAGGSGAGDLDLAGSVSFTGGGKITLGQAGTDGDILNAPGVSGDTLVNVNNTISGNGLIDVSNFDNQAGGIVQDQGFLHIDVGTFGNEGSITDEANSTLDLGQDGATQSLNNTATVFIDAGADLAISGTYTVTGSGAIDFKGAGAEITSDGTPATFTNASAINAFDSGQIGDSHLTFNNSGTVDAEASGITLTINTGGNTVVNSGLLEATSGATLAIVSNVTNSKTLDAGSSTTSGTTTGTLDLGVDGGTGTAINTGVIAIYGGSDLAISGNYTVSGSGSIQLKGAGADITSDGKAPATLTNATTIEALASGQIGDVGIKASNDLTFTNVGMVLASGSGVTLTLNTGTNTINDGGGLLEAENNAILVIDSSVNTGQPSSSSAVGGTVEATSGGTVIVSAKIADSVSGSSVPGNIVVNGGTFEMLAGASVSVPILASGAGDIIKGVGLTVVAGTGTSLTIGDNGLTGANDVVDVSAAAVGGDVLIGGAGASTLTLTSAGSVGLGGVSNFGTINLAAGNSTVTVTDKTLSGGPVTIFDGTSGSNSISAAGDTSASTGKSLTYYAGSGADSFTGGFESDTIFAGTGLGTYTAGSGADTFAFIKSSLPAQTLNSFRVSADDLLVYGTHSSGGFDLGATDNALDPLTSTAINASIFIASSNGNFTSSSQRFAYDTTNGQLHYSATGSNGSASLVATLTGAPSLTASNILFQY